MNHNSLVRVENITKHFPISEGILFRRQTGAVRAVDGVTFDIKKGETLGVVGESGCGKTTLGRVIVQLFQPTSGHVYYHNTDLTALKGTSLRQARRNIQMVFQNPYASLNPRWKVKTIVSEPLRAFNIGNRADRQDQVRELLRLVGLNPHVVDHYPHEFSGGQRQRIGIARALASHPEFIILDEPISALDVSIQAQVVNLLEELQGTLGLTYLFIAHDLSMLRHISDRTAVMYLGKVVELAPRDQLYGQPLHPYTQALLSAVPIPNPRRERSRQRIILEGAVPSPVNPPSGCRFRTRCPVVADICSTVEPEWRAVTDEHWVACHLV